MYNGDNVKLIDLGSIIYVDTNSYLDAGNGTS